MFLSIPRHPRCSKWVGSLFLTASTRRREAQRLSLFPRYLLTVDKDNNNVILTEEEVSWRTTCNTISFYFDVAIHSITGGSGTRKIILIGTWQGPILVGHGLKVTIDLRETNSHPYSFWLCFYFNFGQQDPPQIDSFEFKGQVTRTIWTTKIWNHLLGRATNFFQLCWGPIQWSISQWAYLDLKWGCNDLNCLSSLNATLSEYLLFPLRLDFPHQGLCSFPPT